MSTQNKQIDIERMTILVVDDMKSMRLTIRKMLQHLKIGKHLKFAKNGREGLTILQTSKVDIVIMDWKMPKLNGTQMLEIIRNDKMLRDIPVIMVSAEAERDIVNEVAETEIDGYLLKPLTLNSLDHRVRTVVEKVNNPDKSTILIKEARDLEETGDFKGALRKLKLAILLKPKASRLHRNLGLLYEKNFKLNKAEKSFIKATEINPQDAVSRKILGDLYIHKNELEKAAHYYLEALSLTSRFSETAIQLGTKLLHCGNRKQAIKIFSKIISQFGKNLINKQRIVDICVEYGELEFSRQILDSIIQEFPSKYDVVYQAGTIYTEMGNREKALDLFHIVDRYQSTRIDVKLEIAKIHVHNDHLYKADEYLNMVIQKDPENQEALALRRSI